MFKKQKWMLLASALLVSSCQTYHYAENVSYMSFSNKFGRGDSIGPVIGKDCAWNILGYQLGHPSIEKAFFAAATGKSRDGLMDSFSSSNSGGELRFRYLTNVRTEQDGFNAVVVGKQCVVLKGRGYK